LKYVIWTTEFIHQTTTGQENVLLFAKSTAVLPVALGHASVVLFIFIRLLNLVIVLFFVETVL